MKKNVKKTRIIAAALAIIMVLGFVSGIISEQTVEAADKTMNMDGFSATLISDPDTSEETHIFNGTPAEDGKIWTDKSVTTGAMYGLTAEEENFTVALSAMAQTYNTVETGVSTNEKTIAYDVVFVLDFSGSMEYSIGNNSTTKRAAAMVNALNPAISTLMENNANRIAVVGYSGNYSTSSNSASTLLGLDHYSTTSTTNDGSAQYFSYSNGKISTASGLTNSRETVTADKNVNGGTPTQRGIYQGMNILVNAEETDDGITRIPIMILLSDGEPGHATDNYRTLSGGNSYTGSAHSGNRNAEVGTYTILTANYAKDTVDAAYKDVYDYTGIFESDETVAQFFTIGLGITTNSWTHFVLDPGIEATNSNSTINNMKSYLANDSTYGSDYDYADEYYGGSMTEEELTEAFKSIIESLQVSPTVSSEVNDPISTETDVEAEGNVKFTDYLGYKMELKGDSQYLRYGGVNYRFDKQADGSYTFSGYDQSGNAVTGPVITKGDKTYTLNDVTFKAELVDETYNGQTGYWKITWEFPAALIPTYSRLNDYDNTNLDPIRMLYEVGLMEDTDLQEDSLKIDEDANLASESGKEVADYVFHTNLYVYGEDGSYTGGQAKTWSEYTPAVDNPFYYETGYTTDKTVAGTDTPYIRLDMLASSADVEEIEATRVVQLNKISLSRRDARATFYYNGTQYTVSLSGNYQNGSTWHGETTIPVTASTADGQEITVDVSVRIEATYNTGTTGRSSLTLSNVTVHGETAAISNNNTTASVELTVKKEVESSDSTKDELVSVYMELKGNETDGYYVEDANGKKISVTKLDDGSYNVTLGKHTYYSTTYYRYKDGTVSYVEKELEKGTVATSLVGQFTIDQPDSTTFELTEDNFDEVFQYTASNGITYSATRVTYPDGNYIGAELDPTTMLPPTGTFKVCVDGIKNGLTDVNGNAMEIHFDFIVEAQTTEEGTTRYVVLDCLYWETPDADKYAVDVIVSDTPDISETGDYSYDVSYTIESKHASGEANVTQTDPDFFNSDLTSGKVTVQLGNNGRVSVDISTAYENAVTVQKEWYDRLGNKLDNNSDALKDASVTAGIWQQYSYVGLDEDEKEVEYKQEGTNGTPFATVELNQANDFTYTWETPTLPKYLVDDNGDYRLDKNGNKVPVTYVGGEAEGEAGWTLSEVVAISIEGEDIFTLQNVPLTEFSPSVEKEWTDGAPDGYKVKIELLANGQTIDSVTKIDTQHVVEATLEQSSASSGAELSVKFGEVEVGTKEINLADFEEKANKTYTFTYYGENGNGFGGTEGSGTHAEYATIDITISNTNGEKLGFQNTTISYHYKIIGTEEYTKATLDTFRSQLVETDNTKTATFLMTYTTDQKAEVILDGVVDAEETSAWFNQLNKWNLPMLDKDENGNYTAIVYSIRETVLVPDVNGGIEVDGAMYTGYTPDDNGLIVIPQADGTNKVFKATIENTEDYQFTVTNDEALTSITAEKVWQDNNNAYNTRPDKITFQLKADGTVVEGKDIVIDAASEIWSGTASATWDNLPVYNIETGKEIDYTVEEIMGTLPTSDQYKIEVEADSEDENHFIVTNSLYAEPAINPTSMSVMKEWIDNDNADGTRPQNLYMVLYRYVHGDDADTMTVVPGADIITLDGTVDTVETEAWKASWSELAKYNEDGKKYIYVVKEYDNTSDIQTGEDGVDGYTDIATEKSETSYQFTNKLDDGTISKTVTKVWNDNALESSRPESVTVVLSGTTADGTVDLNPDDAASDVLTQTVNAPSWSYTWENLPKYANGKKIDYSVVETYVGAEAVVENVAGVYTVAVQDDGSGDNFTVINTITGETSVNVTKEWKDTPEGFDIPDVTFDIYSSEGQKLEQTLVVTAANPSDSESGLPKYNAKGELITYTIEEQEITTDGTYRIDSVISGNTGEGGNFAYNATNTYVPLVQDITGTKTWVGTDDHIPAEITIELYRQAGIGEKEKVEGVTPTWTNTDSTVWTYTYSNLPIYKQDGEVETRYTYSVVETYVGTDEVKDGKAGDFTVAVSGLDITNTLGGTVDGADLDGTKTWSGVEAANVPDSIEVELWRRINDGDPEKAVDTDANHVKITVNKKDQENPLVWNYDFTGVTLPKYDDRGNEYTYLVKETKVTAGSTTREVSYTEFNTGTVGDYEVTNDGLKITNKLNNVTVDVPFTKVWKNADGTAKTNDLPDEITVQLVRDGELMADNKYIKTLTSENADSKDASKWTDIFTELPKYAPDGITEYEYTVVETHIEDSIVEDQAAGNYQVTVTEDENGNPVITNQLTDDPTVTKTSLTITKTWVGVTGNNIPNITVQLQQNGENYGDVVALNATTEGLLTGIDDAGHTTWTYTFNNLPARGANGILDYVYTVKEVSVDGIAVNESNMAGDYSVSYEGQNATEVEIVNRLTGAFDKFEGKKIWKDVAKVAERPSSISVELWRTITGGTPEKVDELVVQGTQDNAEWAFEFDNDGAGYAKYDSNGNIYTYYVKETGESDGFVTLGNNQYKVAYGDDKFTITNTLYGEYKPDTNPIKVTKNWLDDDNSQNKRPESVNMTLMRGDSELETITLTKEDATIADTSQHGDSDDNQKPEDPVRPDDSDEDDNEPLNPFEPDNVSDEPETVADEIIVGENSNGWTKAFANTYPMYDEEGKLYVYSVVENTMLEYTLKETTGNAADGFVLTNVYTPGQMTITLNKVWVDNNNALNTRPETIALDLYRNGEYLMTIILQEENGVWSENVNVPMADENGKLYTYTVQEQDSSISGTDYVKSEDGYTVTNTLEGTVDVKGTKSWKNIDEEYRPESVTVELWRQTGNGAAIQMQNADGTAVSVTTTAKDDWAYDFGTLPKYDENGALYIYSVKETMIDQTAMEDSDYKVANGTGYDLENAIKEETETAVNISGTKTWVDNNDQYKMRPESITVNLIRDGEKIDSVVVEAAEDGTWTYQFTELPKYDMSNGKLYTYSVEEEAVENYITVVNGNDITNKLDETKIPKEPENPVEPNKPGVDTGDNANIFLYIALALFAAAAFIAVLIYKKMRRR